MKFKRMFALLLLAMGLIVANVADVSATTMNYQGGWLAKTTYPAAAVVVFKNQTYYALVGANLNKNPVAFPTLWQPLGTFVPTAYKIGSRGPGGGWIFYVDLYDQYPGFTYLEAAPTDIDYLPWCNNSTTSIPAVAGWAANGIGKGKANTTAMLGVCSSGAAKAADLYLTATKSDWFLPSLGELKLMYNNLLEAGVGGFGDNYYWSSTEYDSSYAWCQTFSNGNQDYGNKYNPYIRVRAVRAF
jgi:hypothetical protein